MNILIIDDEEMLRSQLIRYMSLENIEAEGAANGREGMDKIEKHS